VVPGGVINACAHEERRRRAAAAAAPLLFVWVSFSSVLFLFSFSWGLCVCFVRSHSCLGIQYTQNHGAFVSFKK
jgi:hypothetical protein